MKAIIKDNDDVSDGDGSESEKDSESTADESEEDEDEDDAVAERKAIKKKQTEVSKLFRLIHNLFSKNSY